jgi:hypothetical protein
MRSFLSSISEDFRHDFLGHWMRVIGFLVCYLGPMIFIGACYVTRKEGAGWSLSVPLFAWPAILALIALYWRSFRRWAYARLAVMESQNDIQKGRHYAAIILLRIVSAAFVAAPFFLLYWVFGELESLAVSASFCLLVVGIIESVGGFFYVLDAVYTRK